MNVPPPRAADEGAGLLGYIAESVRALDASVERGFEGIRRELSELPRQYVPRLEVDRRFDELSVRVGGVEGRHEAAEKAREVAEREQARERRAALRWRVSTAIAAFAAFAGVVGGITIHFS